AAPFSPGSFSTEMTCPVVTQYCLPPVAITASMASDLSLPVTSARIHETTRRRFASTREPAAYRVSGRLHVLGEPLADEKARAVHPRLHGRQADAERLRDVRVRQALDVVEHERGAVVRRQPVDRVAQHPSELTLERLLVDSVRPVGHRLPVWGHASHR